MVSQGRGASNRHVGMNRLELLGELHLRWREELGDVEAWRTAMAAAEKLGHSDRESQAVLGQVVPNVPLRRVCDALRIFELRFDLMFGLGLEAEDTDSVIHVWFETMGRRKPGPIDRSSEGSEWVQAFIVEDVEFRSEFDGASLNPVTELSTWLAELPRWRSTYGNMKLEGYWRFLSARRHREQIGRPETWTVHHMRELWQAHQS